MTWSKKVREEEIQAEIDADHRAEYESEVAFNEGIEEIRCLCDDFTNKHEIDFDTLIEKLREVWE